ncbi:MAG: sensor histidine kinase [Mariprofundaceae bacterium]
MSLLLSITLFVLMLIGTIYIRKLKRELQENRRQVKRLNRARKNLKAVLKRRRQRQDVLFSEVDEAILRVDRAGNILTANRRATQLFKLDEMLKLPQTMLIFYRDPDWRKALSKALQILPEGSALPDMYVGDRVLVARLASAGNKQAFLLCVDVTRQARLEQQRQTFLTNLMHDLKTPLTSMLGYARSIQSFTDRPDLQREAADTIASEAKHVNDLLENLLTLDSLEHRNRSSESRALLTDACEQLTDLLSFQCEEKQLVLGVNIKDAAEILAIDFDDLMRVMMNVVVNAIEHSPEGGRIDIESEKAGDSCFVHIRDEGPGIPDAHLKHVLERFYQVDKARRRGGHGLGLAIVSELLDIWKGSVHLKNRETHGLEVTIVLKLFEE